MQKLITFPIFYALKAPIPKSEDHELFQWSWSVDTGRSLGVGGGHSWRL